MILDFNRFAKTIGKANKFAQDISTRKNILFKLQGSTLSVCYSDGKKSFIEKLDCELEDGDQDEDAIVLLDYIMEILSVSAGSGNIHCDTLSIKFDGRDKMKAYAEKYYVIENGDETIKRVCSKITKEAPYTVAANMKGGTILTRCNYDDIFKAFESDEDGVYDAWSKQDMREMLDRLSKNEPKACFVSAKMNTAFSTPAAGVAMTVLPIRAKISNGFAMSSKEAKYVADIWNLSDDVSNIYVHNHENRYCYMVSDDNRIGIMFENAKATKLDSANYQKFMSTPYDHYTAVFFREILTDMLKNALATGKSDTATVTFKMQGIENIDSAYEGEELTMNINRGDAMSSLSGFTCSAVTYETGDEAEKPITELSFNIALKVLYNLITNCVDSFVVLNAEKDGNFILLKLTDGHRDENKEIIASAYHYMSAQE